MLVSCDDVLCVLSCKLLMLRGHIGEGHNPLKGPTSQKVYGLRINLNFGLDYYLLVLW